MDFAMLPPEINSGRIYTGPGSGPIMAVATAWDALAEDLYATANSDQAVISELTGQAWSGPAAATMCSVPPETGFAEVDADEVDVDDELHAASAETASAAAASPAKHLGALIMGMFLLVRKLTRAGEPSVHQRC